MADVMVKVLLLEDKFETWMPALTAVALAFEGKVELFNEVQPEEFKHVMERIVKRLADLKAKAQLADVDVANIVLQRNASTEVEYWKLKPKFDALTQLIYEVMFEEGKKNPKPLPYDTIVKLVQAREPSLKAETITRRLREMSEKGQLYKPKRGAFLVKEVV